MLFFGQCGDFTTAPELSPLFAQCFCAAMAIIRASDTTSFLLLKSGGGTGRFAIDLLSALAKIDCLPEVYYIVDISATLRERQRHAIEQEIPELASRVQYLSALPRHQVDGFVIANECFDAMPVERFRLHHGEIEASYVQWEGDRFTEIFRTNHDLSLQTALKKLPWLFEMNDYISEINLGVKAYWKQLNACINQGMVIVIDYGFPRREYYHPERSMGTLMCHYQHRSHHDPFRWVGLQDITAHVDFSAMADHASSEGFELLGYTQQANFLLSSGLLEHAQALINDDERIRLAVNQSIKLLTLPSEIGELFKVMACVKNIDHVDAASMPGFARQRAL